MSSTFNDVRAAIEGRIATEMANSPAIQVAYANVPFTPPDASDWIKVQLQFNDNNYFTLRGPTTGFNRQTGIVLVDIFTPVGVGTGANYTIAERVKDLFDRVTVSNVTFDPASGPFTIQPAAPEAYFQTQVSVTFDAYLQ
jgi:hypothetical protein|tara:strand:+ start:936 stop:1355 length:420 start_codon:yes stop_codon:yes gene_type:complete